MANGYEKNYTPAKPLERSFKLEANEDMEFKLSKLTRVVKSMNNKFKQELDALRYDLHSIKEKSLNEIRVHRTLNSSTQEEEKENKNVESQSHIGKIEAQLEKKRFEPLTFDHSSLQDPHFQGFNSRPRKYFILDINMMKFDGNYPLTWIFLMDKLFETRIKQLRNQEIMEYLIKSKNLPVEDAMWEEGFFIRKHPQLIKH